MKRTLAAVIRAAAFQNEPVPRERARLPARAQPSVRYEIAVVASSRHKPAARAFVAPVFGEVGRGHVRAAGFLSP